MFSTDWLVGTAYFPNHTITNHTLYIFVGCADLVPKGKYSSEDIPEGGQANITCSGGCIQIKKVSQ